MPVTANFAGPVQTDAINRFRMLQSMARISQSSTNQSVPTGSDIAVTLDTSDFNTDSMWSGGNSTRLTAQIAGKYLFIGQITWGSAIATSVRIRKNGTTNVGNLDLTGTVAQVLNVSALEIMAATDYVELVARQNSGGSQTIAQGNNNTWLSAIYLGE